MESIMTETFPRIVTAAELRLGDVVELFDGPFSTAIVRQIEDGKVTFFRPYGTHSDTVYSNGVIPYTGTENFHVFTSGASTYKLWRRNGQLQ
jgi:hypothetical protein